ncbi:MAG: ligase-associated DNA damage response exonuclease [Verrucomicrobiota bacterium]
MALLETTERGLYCAAGDFFIDPWRAVDRALITHAHSDHARPGSASYLCAEPGVALLRERLGKRPAISTCRYGETIGLNGVTVSFHPAGHVLGSAQIRVEHRGEVWVASGDYKATADPTCAPFEPVRCHTFVTESTFGLPIYRWAEATAVFDEINRWWRRNREQGRTSVLYSYSLGKAQRLLAGIDAGIGPILMHEAAVKLTEHYRAAGVALPEIETLNEETARAARGKGLLIMPPDAEAVARLADEGEVSTAFASGWMLVRRMRRQGADRGFVLSDHADWDELIAAIRATGAERVLVTHGYAATLARWLRENGWQADTLEAQFEGEAENA